VISIGVKSKYGSCNGNCTGSIILKKNCCLFDAFVYSGLASAMGSSLYVIYIKESNGVLMVKYIYIYVLWFNSKKGVKIYNSYLDFYL
jgi:hypothetical protein